MVYVPSREACLISTVVVAVFLLGGSIFGWASLAGIFEREGFYASECKEGDFDPKVPGGCHLRSLRFNLAFTVASSLMPVLTLLFGNQLDRYGPKRTSITGAFLAVMGNLCFALGNSEASFDWVLVGACLIAFGGAGIFVCAFQVSNLMPKNPSLILGIINCAFDSSAMTGPLLDITYSANVSRRGIFLFLATICVVYMMFCWKFMPHRSFGLGDTAKLDVSGIPIPSSSDDSKVIEIKEDIEMKEPQVETSQKEDNGSISSTEQITSAGQNKRPASPPAPIPTLKEQATSPNYISVTLFFCASLLRLGFMFGTVADQLGLYMPKDQVQTYVRIFNLLAPAGVISVPVMGWLLDHRRLWVSWMAVAVFGSAMSALAYATSAGVALASFLVFSCFRSMNYTAVSAHLAKTLGYTHFGKLYGIFGCCGGLITLSMPLFLMWAQRSGSFVGPNSFLLGLSILQLAFPLFVRSHIKDDVNHPSAEDNAGNTADSSHVEQHTAAV